MRLIEFMRANPPGNLICLNLKCRSKMSLLALATKLGISEEKARDLLTRYSEDPYGLVVLAARVI